MMSINDAVSIGKAYYHPECAEMKQRISEIIDVFYNHIDHNVIFAQLQRVINTMVFARGIDVNLILFGLKYYVQHGIPLKYPGGLYYVVQNKGVIDEWNKQNNIKSLSEIKCAQQLSSRPLDLTPSFAYVVPKEKGIEDLLS